MRSAAGLACRRTTSCPRSVSSWAVSRSLVENPAPSILRLPTGSGLGCSGFPLRPRFLMRWSRWRMPAMSCAFLTPLLMFLDTFQAPTADLMILANLLIVCAALAVPAAAAAPKLMNEAAKLRWWR